MSFNQEKNNLINRIYILCLILVFSCFYEIHERINRMKPIPIGYD